MWGSLVREVTCATSQLCHNVRNKINVGKELRRLPQTGPLVPRHVGNPGVPGKNAAFCSATVCHRELPYGSLSGCYVNLS